MKTSWTSSSAAPRSPSALSANPNSSPRIGAVELAHGVARVVGAQLRDELGVGWIIGHLGGIRGPASGVRQGGQQLRSGPPGMALAVDGRASGSWPRPPAPRRGSRPDRAPPRRRRGGRPRSGRRPGPSRSARAHRCGSSRRPWSANSASCISQNSPCAAAASAAHAAGHARGWLVRTGKWRKTTRNGSVAQLLLQRRAERALEVGVDDHQALRRRPAHVVLRTGRGQRCRAEAAQRAGAASSASKIRLAPGSSPGDVAS